MTLLIIHTLFPNDRICLRNSKLSVILLELFTIECRNRQMDIWINNRESMKIEIQQRVGLNPFCICHPIISFHNRKTDIHANTIKIVSDMCSRALSEEEGRCKGWDEIWITKDRIVVHNQQRPIDSLFYSYFNHKMRSEQADIWLIEGIR